MSVGERIRDARSKKGPEFTQAVLAAQLGVQSKTIQRWENDKHKPRTDELDALARALDVSLEWLVRGNGEGPSAEADATAGSDAADDSDETDPDSDTEPAPAGHA